MRRPPPPPFPSVLSKDIEEEHSSLNRHLREQSFTPLPLSTEKGGADKSEDRDLENCGEGEDKNVPASPGSPDVSFNPSSLPSIAPQLSWGFGEIADWAEDTQQIKKSESSADTDVDQTPSPSARREHERSSSSIKPLLSRRRSPGDGSPDDGSEPSPPMHGETFCPTMSFLKDEEPHPRGSTSSARGGRGGRGRSPRNGSSRRRTELAGGADYESVLQLSALSPSSPNDGDGIGDVLGGKMTPLPFSVDEPLSEERENMGGRGLLPTSDYHRRQNYHTQHRCSPSRKLHTPGRGGGRSSGRPGQHAGDPDQRQPMFVKSHPHMSPRINPLSSPSYHDSPSPQTPSRTTSMHQSSSDQRDDSFKRVGDQAHGARRDGPPHGGPGGPQDYQSPRNLFIPPPPPGHHRMMGGGGPQNGGADRIRNLRGRAPQPGSSHNGGPGNIPPSLHLPSHLPPPHHHHNLTSPMVGGRQVWGHHHHGGHPRTHGPPHHIPPSPHHHPGHHPGIAHHHSMHSPSKRKCVPLKPPIPSKFQGDMEKIRTAQVPEFTSLVNFPIHMSQKQAMNLPEGMRCCVMCGQACPCSATNKNKKPKGGIKPEGGAGSGGACSNNPYAIIPTQNKGLCTMCDVNVWVVTQTGLEIKWCKGCKNFRPWAAFGDKGLATKCVRCRERQREKYAAQKEEKEKAKARNTNCGITIV